MNTKDLLISLLKSAISDSAVSSEAKESLKSGNIATLFKVSKAHDMAHLVAYAIEKSGIEIESETRQNFLSEYKNAIVRYDMMEADIKDIVACFEKEKIEYIPLKGAVVRKAYPSPWMRTSCDVDILVREEELERAVGALVSNCFYKTEGKKTYHDVSLFSPFGMHLELHYNIKEDTEKYDELLTQVWQFSEKEQENRQKYVQSNEFLMFHLTAHAAYHFVGGGCGLRSVLDIWLLDKTLKLNREELNAFLEKTQLLKFYDAIVKLGEHWFGEKITQEQEILEMEKYILLGGVYGTKKQGAVSKQIKKGGKFKYFWSRVFMPYQDLAILYPVIKKHKILTPFCQIARWFGTIFKGKRIAREIKRVSGANEESINETRNLLEYLEL